jgi:hypothetical protein
MIGNELVQPLVIVARHVGRDVDPAVPFDVAAVMMQTLQKIVFLGHRFEIDHGEIAALGEIARLVEDIGDAARHAGGEIAPGLADHDDDPPVMYSQPWSPVPSTTAMAPELRTAKRSPATPRK